MEAPHPIRALLTALLCALIGCGEPEVSQDSSILPLPGQWKSPILSFEVGDEGISSLRLNNLGCLGNVTPAGVPLCDSLVEGDWELPLSSPYSEGSVSIETPFGLMLEGSFQSEDIFAGSYTYVAPNGCCSSSGTLTASHESLAQENPIAPCHVTTGDEVIGLHAVELEGSGLPRDDPLVNLDEVTVVDGFQGGMMVVVALLTENMSLGDLRVQIDLQIPALGISASAETTHVAFKGNQEKAELSPVWLLLEDEEGELLTPEDGDSLQDTDAEVSIQITSPCGFLWTKEYGFRVNYAF